ncbi:MAG: hypothetical protein OIF32_07250 [Campylobacterales bacterium]|nr:hypothetical protein [Campylobacterales bacterium]
MFKMILIITLLAVTLFGFPQKRYVQKKYYLPAGKFAMGIVSGDETGVTFKGFLSKKTAITGMYGKDTEYEYINLNYILHNHTYFDNPAVSIYYGFGMRHINMLQKDGQEDVENKYGFRIPFGVTYIFKKTPFDVFMEVAPEIDVHPKSETDTSFFAGGRFWF